MSIKAMKQALEALERSETTVPYEGFGISQREAIRKHAEAITALRAAIEQTPCNPAEDGVCEALDCCKQQLEDARTEAVALRVNEQNLIAALEAEREACAKVAGAFAQKWWSIHCASNKHMETTRKAHDDFCALQAAIRARSNT